MEPNPPRSSYATLGCYADAEWPEKKSVFIAWASPITSEKDAMDLVARARSRYPDAGHHVYAWILGGNDRRSRHTDDGEPSGTAGLPLLETLLRNNLEDAIIVVTRYFGGTLLGTGGLLRAYTSAAAQAVQRAGLAFYRRSIVYDCTAEYADFEKIRRAVHELGGVIDVSEYGEKVRFIAALDDGQKEALLPAINDAGCGRASVLSVETRLIRTAGSGAVP